MPTFSFSLLSLSSSVKSIDILFTKIDTYLIDFSLVFPQSLEDITPWSLTSIVGDDKSDPHLILFPSLLISAFFLETTELFSFNLSS